MSEENTHSSPLNEREIAVLVRALGGGSDPNDVASDLCVQKNIRWSEAEALIARIQQDYSQQIRRRNKSSLVILGLGIIAGGGLLSFIPALNAARVIRYLVRTGQFDARALFAGGELGYLNELMPLHLQPYFFFTGFAMVMGGIVGLYFALREESLE